MADISQTEAISKAVVSERIGHAPVGGSVESVAAEMLKRSNESNWADTLKFGSEQEVTREGIFGRIDQIGAKRNARGERIRDRDEKTRFNNATAAAELALAFKEKGFEGLSNPDQDAVKDRIKSAILQNRVLAGEFNSLNAADQEAFIKRIASDNAYSLEERAALGRFADKPEVDDTSSQKQEELDEAVVEQSVAQSELDDVQRRLTSVETRLLAFDASSTPPGAQAQEMERIKNELPRLQSEAAGFQQTINQLNQSITALRNEKNSVPNVLRQGFAYAGRDPQQIENDIATAVGQLQTATTEFNSRSAEINKLSQLEQQQQNLEQQRLDLKKEESEKKIAKGKADLEFTRAQRELQDAISLRRRQEQDIVDSLNGVFSEATRELIDKQIDAYGVKFEESLKEVKDKAANEDEKAFYDSLAKQFTKSVNRRFGGSKPRRVIDRARVNQSFNELLVNGDIAYVKKMMQGLLNTENPRTGQNYTQTEIDDLIKNKEFIEKVTPEALKQVVARKAVIGGIEPADVYNITHSTWGENLITNAISSNESFRTQAEALLGQGALDSPDFMERLRREAQENPGLVATLLAAIAAGGAFALTGIGGAVLAGAVAGGGGLGAINYNRGNRLFG